MRPNSRQLAMRDPALAAVMGALPGSDFGGRGGNRRRANHQADFGDLAGFGWGAEDEGGYDIGVAPPLPPAGHHPTRGGHPMHPAVRKHNLMQQHTHNRGLMLDPNRYSTIKVEGYSFPINPNSGAFTLGTAVGFEGTLQPNARIRPVKAITNVSMGGFVQLTTIQVANVNAIIGGTDDAVSYSFLVQGQYIKLPPLDMSTRGTMTGNYTGFVPPGYTSGQPYLFALTLQGPAALAGNG